ANQWVDESADVIEEEDFDLRVREKRIQRQRCEAMAEILARRGFEGIADLLVESNAAGTVGQFAAQCITELEEQVDFALRCLSIKEKIRSKAEGCLQGFLWGLGEDARSGVILAALEALPSEERSRLFVCSPFQEATWRLLDAY